VERNVLDFDGEGYKGLKFEKINDFGVLIVLSSLKSKVFK
jgi:hypothetical protein